MNTETLTLVTTPVTKLVTLNGAIEIKSDSWKVQDLIRLHAFEIVGETCFAVKLTKTLQKDPSKPFFGRKVLDWEKGRARLAKLMASA